MEPNFTYFVKMVRFVRDENLTEIISDMWLHFPEKITSNSNLYHEFVRLFQKTERNAVATLVEEETLEEEETVEEEMFEEFESVEMDEAEEFELNYVRLYTSTQIWTRN